MKGNEILHSLGIALKIATPAALLITLIIVLPENLAAAVEVAVLTALVGVTYMYVRHTENMSQEMKKQADIMLDGQYNAVAPVVTLAVPNYYKGGVIRIEWENVGMGPALNFRCWIEDEENPQLRSIGKLTYRAVVPSEHSLKDKPIIDGENVPTELEGYVLNRGSRYVKAQYQSIFGKAKTYESCLMFRSPTEFELYYSEAQDIVDFLT